MPRTGLFAAAVLSAAPLAMGQFDITPQSNPITLVPGDIVATRVYRDDVGPVVVRYSQSNPQGQQINFGEGVTRPAKFALPTTGGDMFVSNGTLFKNPNVVRINRETGATEALFTPDILVTAMAYHEAEDVLYVTMLAPYTGTRLYAFGPDDLLEPTLIYNSFAFNGEGADPETRNHLQDLTIDGEGNLYMIVKPFENGTLEGNDRVARIDAETGEIEFVRDSLGFVVQFPEGMDALIAMPDGTLVVNSSPLRFNQLETIVYSIDPASGQVAELFRQDSGFPAGGDLRRRHLAVESDDSFIFPLTIPGGQGETLVRYRFSTESAETVAVLPDGFIGPGSLEELYVVPMPINEDMLASSVDPQNLAGDALGRSQIKPNTKTYAKERKAYLKALKKEHKALAKAERLRQKELERAEREARRYSENNPYLRHDVPDDGN